MAIRKPARGTEEERVYDFWWGGSIWHKPEPDEVTYLVMNRAYDHYKNLGFSEEMIFHVPNIDPVKRRITSYHGFLRERQLHERYSNPAMRQAENAALRK